MDQLKPGLLQLLVVTLSVVVFAAACVDDSIEPLSSSLSTTSQPTTTSSVSSSTMVDSALPDWATATVVEVDPISLAPVGPAIPAGSWVEGSAVTDDLIALATWPCEEMDRTESRWRLVVASRKTGELLFDERVGDMNVLAMFPASSGEVMIVEPIRSADWNFADGFVVRGYNFDADELREAARFNEGDFQPHSLTLLSDGRLGLVGAERNGDVFDRLRIVVFDWEANEAVTDVILDDLSLEADAPDGVFVDHMHHPVVWDQARARAIVIHAHEDAVTTVTVPNGEVEEVALVENQSLLNALIAWLVPKAHAKGLPSSQRQAVISGDHLYIAGAAVTFQSNGDGTHAYTYSATDLLRVELETLEIVDRAQVGATAITASRDGGYLLAGGETTTGQVGEQLTTTETEEYTDLLVIDPKTLDVVARHAEGHLTSRYQAQAAPAANIIYVKGTADSIVTFDPISGKVTSTDVSGTFEPDLLKSSLRYASQFTGS